MNPKQFLAFSVVGLIGFFRVANGSGSGGEVPPLLPDDTDHNESPKNGSGQERNLPLKTVAHAEQSHLSTDSAAMDSAHSKSSNPEKDIGSSSAAPHAPTNNAQQSTSPEFVNSNASISAPLLPDQAPPSSVADPQIAPSELCPICLHSLNDGEQSRLQCSHLFHTECINSWRQMRTAQDFIPDCPICRKPLPTTIWHRTFRGLRLLGRFIYHVMALRWLQIHFEMRRGGQRYEWNLNHPQSEDAAAGNAEGQSAVRDEQNERSQREIENELRIGHQHVLDEIQMFQHQMSRHHQEMRRGGLEADAHEALRSHRNSSMQNYREAIETSRGAIRHAREFLARGQTQSQDDSQNA